MATRSFNLFDFKLDRGTFGITYLPVLPVDVDGKTSVTTIGADLGGVTSPRRCDVEISEALVLEIDACSFLFCLRLSS